MMQHTAKRMCQSCESGGKYCLVSNMMLVCACCKPGIDVIDLPLCTLHTFVNPMQTYGNQDSVVRKCDIFHIPCSACGTCASDLFYSHEKSEPPWRFDIQCKYIKLLVHRTLHKAAFCRFRPDCASFFPDLVYSMICE